MEMPAGAGKHTVSLQYVVFFYFIEFLFFSILPRNSIISSQCFRLLLEASPWLEGKGSAETFNFVLQSVHRFLMGVERDHSLPPPVDILLSPIFEVGL